VETKGFEGSIGWQLTDTFSVYGSTTYTGLRTAEDQIVTTITCPTGETVCTAGDRVPLFIPTKGKAVVETPEWMHTLRADWDMNDFLSFGLQAEVC